MCTSSNNVHMCGKGCNLRKHNRDSTLVCPISGRCFEQTMSTNAYKNEPRSGFTTVDALRRDTITPSRYRASNKRARPHTTLRIFDEYKCRVVINKLFDPPISSERVQYYCNVIHTLWNLYSDSSSTITKPNFDAHVLGTLFLCKDGLRMNDKNVIYPDKYLIHHIPSINRLLRLDIPKKWIRIGKNNLLSIFRALDPLELPQIPKFKIPPSGGALESREVVNKASQKNQEFNVKYIKKHRRHSKC